MTEQTSLTSTTAKKTLAYFVFAKSSFGGQLHIPYYDEDGTSDGGDWELDQTIK